MEKNTAKTIGLRINTVLADRKMLQKDLASMLGVTPNTISYFAKGERTPNIEQIIKISKALNISSDYLLGLSDVKSTESDIKQINETTDLSENAIKQILRMKDCDSAMVECLSILLEDNEICDMIWSVLRAKESLFSGLQRLEQEYDTSLKELLGINLSFSDSDKEAFDRHMVDTSSLSRKYTFIPREDACKFYIQEALNHLRNVIEKTFTQED